MSMFGKDEDKKPEEKAADKAEKGEKSGEKKAHNPHKGVGAPTHEMEEKKEHNKPINAPDEATLFANPFADAPKAADKK